MAIAKHRRRPSGARGFDVWSEGSLRRLLLIGLGFVAALWSPVAFAADEVEPAVAPAPASIEDFSKPMGPPDPFNRGTPRGSVYGFINACRDGDYERAAAYLDLRRLPPEERERGPELARRLKTVLDQKLWIDYGELSDRNSGFADDGVKAWQDRVGEIESAQGLVTILLQRVARQGDQVRIWKVSAATVAQIDGLYSEFGPSSLETWLPPAFFALSVFDLALWQIAGLALSVFVGWLLSLVLAGTLVRLLSGLFMRGGGALDERIVRVVGGPVRMGITIVVFGLANRRLRLDIPVLDTLRLVEHLLFVVAVTWLALRLIDIAVVSVRARALERENSGLLPVLPPLQLIAKITFVTIAVLGMLGSLGVDVTAAVAGLGVGGIAVAFAAQKTLENLFGGVSLFADRPVRVGDFFRYGDQVGTVEEIGLRSTRVRTLDRTVISIPNGEFSNMALENFARRDRMRLWTTLGVRYETTPEQLRFLLARLREILVAHPRILEDPARVRFVGFGAYSLDIEVMAYVDTEDWNEFLGIREDLFLRFMDTVAEAGSSFAFPSTVAYLGRDEGLDPEDARRAEAEVRAWREQGQLPFPNFAPDARRALEDSLPWPPPGSPEGPPHDPEASS
ncbi:MAG: mechanosensitive ion channel family protein [Myxococcota bacterium]